MLAVAVLAALLNIANFLLSESGGKAVQERLVDWYFYIDEGDWSRLVISSAQVTERFLGHALGNRFFSWKYFLATLAFGIIFFCCIAVGATHASAVAELRKPELYPAVLFNAVVDTMALGTTRLLMRRISTASKPRLIWRDLFLVFLICYIAMGVAANGLVMLGVIFQHENPLAFLGNLPTAQAVILTVLVVLTLIVGYPVLFFWIGQPLVIIGLLPAGASTILLLGTLLGSWLLSLLRPVLRKPLALIVERLAEAPKGLITTVLNGLLIVGAVLTALKSAQ